MDNFVYAMEQSCLIMKTEADQILQKMIILVKIRIEYSMLWEHVFILYWIMQKGFRNKMRA